jgi:hypothetical protein
MSEWNGLKLAEMKKFLGMIIIMDQVNKDTREVYCSLEYYDNTPSAILRIIKH